jgi:hypothetical protein
MKSKVVSLVVLWVLSLFASIGYAQTSNHSALTVKVPFEFVVGNQTFPAGTYKFRSLLNSVPGKDTIDVIEVRSTEGHLYHAIVTDVVGSEEPNHSKLVFTRSGGRTFLSEVWEAEKQAGCQLRGHEGYTQAVESEDDKLTLTASKTDLR